MQRTGLRVIWALKREPLSEAEGVRELWARALQACGEEALAYDLNQRAQWRAFDADRLIVDTLTQRTQLVMVRLGGGGLLAVVTGKHGERPRLIMELAPSDAHAQGRLEDLARASASMIEGQVVFARIDRLEQDDARCVWVGGRGQAPERLQAGLDALVGVELTSTPGGWHARVSTDALGDPRRSDWQALCDAISADLLT